MAREELPPAETDVTPVEPAPVVSPDEALDTSLPDPGGDPAPDGDGSGHHG